MVRGSDPVCGHSALLCSVATVHALNSGLMSCNAYGTLLWSLLWSLWGWENQLSSKALTRRAAQNVHPEGSRILCRIKHSNVNVLWNISIRGQVSLKNDIKSSVDLFYFSCGYFFLAGILKMTTVHEV